jgi:uncharacterized protein
MAKQSQVEIIETAFVNLDKPIVIEGFPSVGLVGSIATEYIATKLEMDEVGFIQSDKLPPVTIVKDGVPKSPIRIYAKNNLVVFVSDTAIPEHLTYDLSRAIVGWAKKHNATRIISVGGIARPDGAAPTGKIYVVGSDEAEIKYVNSKSEKRYTPIKLGFLTGLLGILLLHCSEEKLPAHAYLTDASLETPDPKAAADVVGAVAEEIGLKVDTASLIQTSEKLEKKINELMRQTKKSLDDQQAYPSVYG